MLLPEAISKSESLRAALVKAKPIMDLAFHAAMNHLDSQVQLDDVNVLTNAQRHAKRVGVLEFINLIQTMSGTPKEEPSPLVDSYLGMDAFDMIAAKAEKEAAEKESLQPPPKKGK
jgi:hypothetical protein